MKYGISVPIKPGIEKLRLTCGKWSLEHCKDPSSILVFLSAEDARKSFPPDGKLVSSDLDTFFYIKLIDEVVGFYRIIDLFFDGEIELHGSFLRHETLLNRAYFQFTSLFVNTIQNIFPQKTICTTVLKENYAVQRFLDYLEFQLIDEIKKDSPYIRYIRPKKQHNWLCPNRCCGNNKTT